MTTPEARLESLRGALLTGLVVRERLLEVVNEVESGAFLEPERLVHLTKAERRTTDSMALSFANLVGLVQDQLIRLILLVEEEDLLGASRREQRRKAAALGVVRQELRFERAAEVRNRIAHQYPRDPVRQSRLLRDIADQSATAIAAFDEALTYSLSRFFGGKLE